MLNNQEAKILNSETGNSLKSLIDSAIGRLLLADKRTPANLPAAERLPLLTSIYPFLQHRLTNENYNYYLQLGHRGDDSENLLLSELESADGANQVADLLIDNPWLLAYTSPTHDDTLHHEEGKPFSTTQLLKIILDNLYQADFEKFKRLSMSILRNIDKLQKLVGDKWVEKVMSVLNINDEDLWTKEIGLEIAEYEFYLKYQYYFAASSQLIGEISRLGTDKASTFSKVVLDNQDPPRKQIIRTKDPEQIGVVGLARRLPEIGDKSWLTYEQALIGYWQGVLASKPQTEQLITAVEGYIKYLDQKGAAQFRNYLVNPDSKNTPTERYYLPYPLMLNALRRMVSEKFEAKSVLEKKRARQHNWLDQTDSSKLLHRNSQLMLSYLILRKLLFPQEDLRDLTLSSKPTHLDLGSVYTRANFERYSESEQLKETGYRVEMLDQILSQIGKAINQHVDIFELGSGDGWLAEQLAERGYKVRGLELNEHNQQIAQARLASLGDTASVELGSWDELGEWQALAERNQNHIGAFLWLGRSATHEEDELAFRSTLSNFSAHMKIGDYLFVDMPNPASGIYDKFITEMIEALNEAGKRLNPPVKIDRTEFEFIVDSPNQYDFYNRYVASYNKLKQLFYLAGFDIETFNIGDVGAHDFRSNLAAEQQDYPECIYERVNYRNLGSSSDSLEFTEGMNARRNMVFVLKKITNAPGFWLNPKRVYGLAPGHRNAA